MDRRLMGWMLSLGALSCAAGCGAADDGEQGEDGAGDVDVAEVGESEQAVSANPGLCQNGMSTTLKKLHPASDFPGGVIPAWFTCSLAQAKEMVDYVCKTDPIVCNFLKTVVDGHGLLQCTKYIDSQGNKKACVDIVDKYADGSLLQGKPQVNSNFYRNFMVILARDEPTAADRVHWDAQLPLWPDPPVELSVAGHYFESAAVAGIHFSKSQPAANNFREIRVLKADPRDCSGCGLYSGPNFNELTDLGETQLSTWFPDFIPSNCRFYTQGTPSLWKYLDPVPCNAEAVWRATAR